MKNTIINILIYIILCFPMTANSITARKEFCYDGINYIVFQVIEQKYSISVKINRDTLLPESCGMIKRVSSGDKMYYEEKLIEGIMCSRTSPDRGFTPMSLEALSKKYNDLIHRK